MHGRDCKERVHQKARDTVSAVGREEEISFREQTELHSLTNSYLSPAHKQTSETAHGHQVPFQTMKSSKKSGSRLPIWYARNVTFLSSQGKKSPTPQL